MSERIEGKAMRYLAEGRLTVRERAGLRVRATCQGSEAEPYALGHDAAGGWFCSCPAFGDCAHLHALKLVAAPAPAGVALRAALAGVNAAYAALPLAVQEAIEVGCDDVDRDLDAALRSGDRTRALAAIRAWRDHWLHEFGKAAPS